MYAIVDIETTGSHAQNNGITEIAILLHNGKEIEGRYETLINPGYSIPKYVAALTGITNEMVALAPRFEEVAVNIYNLLHNRIFIAHNVNFDYSFVKYHLRRANYEWSAKKLCTLRLSRKAFAGLARYGLGSLCRELEIPIQNRHRAGGDAEATAILFEKIIAQAGVKIIKDFLQKDGREQVLPPNLPKEQITQLPYQPGVYYFHDAKGKVIYVGKAKSLKQRVVSHFTGLDTGKKRQEFLRTIHSISYTVCSTEFTASIVESAEIKRLWPEYNYSQKRREQAFGMYVFEDGKGYLRICIDKKKKYVEPLATFGLLVEAHRTVWKLVKDFELNTGLCFLEKLPAENSFTEDPALYNAKVKTAIAWLVSQQPSYAIVEQVQDHQSCVLVEKGKLYGLGQLPITQSLQEIEPIKSYLTIYPENEVIKSMIYRYTEKHPEKIIRF